MGKVKAILIKPINGEPIGSEQLFEPVDFDRLEKRGAVRAATPQEEKAASKTKRKAAKKPKNKAAPEPENKSA